MFEPFQLTDWLGTLGVSTLLIAFALNLDGRLAHTSHAYHGLNAFGAGVLLVVAWRIEFIPFVILEGVWMLVALLALAGLIKQRGT